MNRNNNKLKQMYVLSLISNLNANYPTCSEEELYDNILKVDDCLADPTVINMTGGKWDVVWGPAIVNTAHKYDYLLLQKVRRWITDNALYIAKKQDTQEYFIGIAGTNLFSNVGWFVQDFDVTSCVVWPPAYLQIKHPNVEGIPYISKGADVGLKALINLRPHSNAKGAGTSFMDFLLEEVKNKECSIDIGGHSLGGCLAPLGAVALADKMQDSPYASQYQDVQINAYPTAGPTPGNEDFANHLQHSVQEYHAVLNVNDIITQAWDAENLDDLARAQSTWSFGGHTINPYSNINYSILDWIANYARTQNYVRRPTTPSPNFKITTWHNDLVAEVSVDDYSISPKDFEAYVLALSLGLQMTPAEDELERLASAVIQESAEARLENWTEEATRPPDTLLLKYQSKYSSKRISRLLFNRALEDFVNFALQVCLQHTAAYNNPTSTTGNVPWEFEDNERATLQKHLNSGKQQFFSKAKDISWQMSTAIDLTTRFAKLVADWAEENVVDNSEFATKGLFSRRKNKKASPEETKEAKKLMERFREEMNAPLHMIRKFYYI